MTPQDFEKRMTIEPPLTKRNAFNGETFVFTEGAADPETCRFDVILEQGGSGGGNALVHVHPFASETFTVKSGRLAVVMRGVELIAEQGQSITIPAGTPHHFSNADAGLTEATVQFTPAQQHRRFFENFATLTERRPEWFSPQGDPKLLLIALVLHRYRDHLYLAGIPIVVQKMVFALLSPLARIRGYRLAVEPLESGRQP
jgi:mannose-6-phosphate isomerase-like protein (cupin superfamily)